MFMEITEKLEEVQVWFSDVMLKGNQQTIVE
jgi:hypothetical protein